MTKKIIKKIIEYVVILICVTTLIFFLIHWFSPTDPISVIIGGKGGTVEQIEAAREQYHLDQPVWKQYMYWLASILQGDWGTSYKYHTSVWAAIVARLPVTLGLVLGATILSVIVAIPLGVFSAVRKGKSSDRIISITSLFLAAIPPFLLSMILILCLSKVAPSYPITGGYTGIAGYMERMLWPCIALACSKVTITLKVTRQGMIEQLERPYIMNIEAKGMGEGNRIWKHALRNALAPVISILSIQVGAMIVGAVLVENVFSLSGIGSLLIDSIKSSDFPVVQAIILLLVIIFMATGVLADILYGIIDPRIRAERRG